METSFAISEIDVKLQQDVSSSPPSYPAKSWLGLVTTFEPLKVCLDDDSSIEDEDEDMFDDDAFTFDDNDFQAIMSHEAFKRSMSLNNSMRTISRSTSLSSVDSLQHQTTSSSPQLLPSHPSAPLLSKATNISTDSSPAASTVSASCRDAPHFLHRLNFQTPSVPCDSKMPCPFFSEAHCLILLLSSYTHRDHWEL
jgi:hypothetical protein